MHPIVSSAERGWLVLASAPAIGVLIATLPLRLAGAGGDAGWFAPWGAAIVFGALIAWKAARYVPVTTPFARFSTALLLASCMAGGVWTGVGYLIADAASDVWPRVAPAMADVWPALWVNGSVTFLAVLLLTYAVDAADRGEASARRALESDVASRAAELRALRAQVNPHFLFNCLNSISSMTSRDPDGARRMCLELAEFFRSSLKAGAEQRVPLTTELALLRTYLSIEQVRFGTRLDTRFEERGDLSGITVPPLLLQPLVENAVRHGVATLIEGGPVRIAAAREGDRVSITVENPFDPDGRRPGTGVGLANVRERLEAAYRGRASVRAETIEGDEVAPAVFRVSMSLPAPAGVEE